MSGHTKSRGLLAKSLLLLVSVALTLLALEGLVRLLDIQTASYHSISGFCRYDPALGWNLIPNHRVVFRGRYFSALVETSSQGLRDRVYPLKPEPGRRRVLVLGDSVAWCWGVQMEECFTKLMESELDNTDVITMGVPGYSTAQAMRLYELQGRRFNPHVVMLVFVGNDPVDNLDRRRRPHFELQNGALIQTNNPVPRRKHPLKEWLTQNSRLYVQAKFGTQVGKEVIKVLREKMESDAPMNRIMRQTFQRGSADEESWQLTEALLERLRAQVIADGAEFVLAIVGTVPPTSDKLIRFCTERGCRVTDTTAAMGEAIAAGRQVLLRGDPHFSPEGQRFLAEQLLPLLEPH